MSALMDDERTGQERRKRPGNFMDRTHLNGAPEPPVVEERVIGPRRRQVNGSIHDRRHLFAVERADGRTSVSLPTRLSYILLGLGLALTIFLAQLYIDKATTTANDTAKTQEEIQKGRVKTLGLTCTAINKNAAKANENTAYIEGLLVAGVVLPGDRVVKTDRKTKLPTAIEPGPFSRDLARRYDFPSPNARLAKAQKQAEKLHKLNIPPLNCERLKTQVRENKG